MKLRFLTKVDQNLLQNYYLSEESLRFTKHPSKRFEQSICASQEYLVGAFNDEVMVGFFALDYSDNKLEHNDIASSILLRSLSIDDRYQKQGHAKSMLSLLPDFIANELEVDVTHIVFGVGEINYKARALYESLGYIYTGERHQGRSCQNLSMIKAL